MVVVGASAPAVQPRNLRRRKIRQRRLDIRELTRNQERAIVKNEFVKPLNR